MILQAMSNLIMDKLEASELIGNWLITESYESDQKLHINMTPIKEDIIGFKHARRTIKHLNSHGYVVIIPSSNRVEFRLRTDNSLLTLKHILIDINDPQVINIIVNTLCDLINDHLVFGSIDDVVNL